MTTIFSITAVNDTDDYVIVQQFGEYISDIEMVAAHGRTGLAKAIARLIPYGGARRQTSEDLARTIDLLREQLAENEAKIAGMSSEIAAGNYTPEVLAAIQTINTTRTQLTHAESAVIPTALTERVMARVRTDQWLENGGVFDTDEPLSEEEATAMEFPEGVEPTLGNFVIHGYFRHKFYLTGQVEIRTLEVHR